MSEIGKKNKLIVLKELDFGVYLDGGELGEILMPNRYIPQDVQIGDEVEVFVYKDSEDRLIATTEDPYAQVGECSYLEVVSVGDFGAFMDWGVMKDLLVPFKEQRVPMKVGRSYAVFLFVDVTGRIAASSKLSKFMPEEDKDGEFVEGQKVNLQIASRSDIGYKAVINGTHLGVIHNNDILHQINVGQELDGYIKKIREDKRIDLALQAKGKDARNSLEEDILEFLQEMGGSSDLTDKSSPDDIYKTFQVSKSNYKKALGKLYKEKKVSIEKGLRGLLPPDVDVDVMP